MAAEEHIAEEWHIIKEAPHYAVSNIGRVKRVTPDKRGRFEGLIMRTRVNQHGYRDVILRVDGEKKHYTIHRLVCLAFRGPKPSPAHAVRHLDGTRTNNRAGNLCWGTYKENSDDAEAHGTRLKGGSHGRAKLTEAEVRQIRGSGKSTRELGRQYGVGNTTIQKVKSGQNWAHLLEAS